jgi:filamin
VFRILIILFLCTYRFAVSFVPAEACEHVINVSFNKSGVPGCPILVQVSGNASGPQVSLNGPGPVHQPNSLIITHPGGRLDDVEVNVEGEFDDVENYNLYIL